MRSVPRAFGTEACRSSFAAVRLSRTEAILIDLHSEKIHSLLLPLRLNDAGASGREQAR